MNIRTLLSKQESTLRKKIKKYQQVAREIKSYLDKHPAEWGRYQSDFNIEVNGIFRDIMNFEKERLAEGDEDSIYKLKRIFVNHLRKDFVFGEYIRWSLEKPYGYAGDHKIIDDIYQNNPKTTGIHRLYDNYFQTSSVSIAVRNRKEDFESFVLDCVSKRKGKKTKILDIASGPCRDLKDLLNGRDQALFEHVSFDCFDADPKAIMYAQRLLNRDPRIHFTEMNIVRLALQKDIQNNYLNRYDMIYSTGLFDYLDERITVRLINNLRQILKPDGILAISDVRDKFSNPSIYFMEWVGDWNLIYRPDDEFRLFFIEAGFNANNLSYSYEQQGIMQYVVAKLPT